ncbi:MAG: DUF3300 domain-containing protein [Gammaproteobacteria bacterium]|jgi:hypothetical protein|nr:DUF3300 domain-containing protein [Gammaproteobacteria bacterium]
MKTLTTLVFALMLTVGCSATGQVQAKDDYFSQAELDSMLAPVALYPDSVLSHVLIAATYPLEVIQAARWSREHPGLRGEDAVAAVEYQNWDASVKALVAFPELLRRMDEDLQWTQDLGDAFLIQEEEVIASIQYLRSEAYSQGHLRSNDHVKVVREREYIYIEPARTRVVYVPYYDPRVIYTKWRWTSYRPHYWHHPVGYRAGVSFYWGHAYHIRPSFYFSSFHWPTRRVVVVNHHHYYREHRFHSAREVARFDHARHWKHDPVHRRGVSYRGRVEQTRFVDSSRHVSSRSGASVDRASTRSSTRSSTAAVRSDRREWAAQRRSSMDFDRQASTSTRSSAQSRSASRSERISETRDIARGESRSAARSSSESRSAVRGSERATLQAERSRTVSGRAPSRSESSSRNSGASRASSAGRVSESLRSGSSSRAASTRSSSTRQASSRESAIDRSRGAERSSSISGSRSASDRSYGGRSSDRSRNRSGPDRYPDSSSRQSATISSSRPATLRSSSGRERQSSPSRSSRAGAASSSRQAVISRQTAPSRQSAPTRSRSSGGREPTQSAPRSRASAPSRSSQSAPSRSRSAGTRSSRGSESRRSRGNDGRGGGRGEERR